MTMVKNRMMVTFVVATMVMASTVFAGDPPPAGTFDGPGPDQPMFAQAPGDPGPMHGGPGHGPLGDRSRQRKHLEQLRMLKMLELLNLTPEQEVPFLTAFNQMRTDQHDLDGKVETLLDSMSTEMGMTKPSESRLKDLIARVKATERQRFEKFFAFADKVDTLLTTEQIAKLMIFQKRFEMELLEQIGRFRRGGPIGPGGPDEPSDSGGY